MLVYCLHKFHLFSLLYSSLSLGVPISATLPYLSYTGRHNVWYTGTSDTLFSMNCEHSSMNTVDLDMDVSVFLTIVPSWFFNHHCK